MHGQQNHKLQAECKKALLHGEHGVYEIKHS